MGTAIICFIIALGLPICVLVTHAILKRKKINGKGDIVTLVVICGVWVLFFGACGVVAYLHPEYMDWDRYYFVP